MKTLRASDSLASNGYLGSRCAWDPTAIFSTECWAATYEALQYGRITRPGDVAPPLPAAPQSQAAMTTAGAWTPADATGGMWSDYALRITEQAKADEAAGRYNPAGNLPISAQGVSDAAAAAADAWDTYKYWICGAAVLLAGALVLDEVRR